MDLGCSDPVQPLRPSQQLKNGSLETTLRGIFRAVNLTVTPRISGKHNMAFLKGPLGDCYFNKLVDSI